MRKKNATDSFGIRKHDANGTKEKDVFVILADFYCLKSSVMYEKTKRNERKKSR